MTTQTGDRSGESPTATDEEADRRPRRRWSRARIVILVVAVVGLGAVLLLTGGGDDGGAGGGGAGSVAAGPGEGVPSLSGVPDGYVTYRDEEAGFTLAHPQTWIQTIRPQGDVRLVLGAGDGTTLRVRVAELEQAIDGSNLEEIRAVTSGIVATPNPTVEKQFLKGDSFSVNDLPGYYYLYTLKNTETGEDAVNAVYFVFQGRKMNILMFQALSAEDFELHAADFDTILSSFRSDPSPPTG